MFSFIVVRARMRFKEYIPSLSAEDTKAVLKKVNMKVQNDTVIRFIMNGYNQIDGVK